MSAVATKTPKGKPASDFAAWQASLSKDFNHSFAKATAFWPAQRIEMYEQFETFTEYKYPIDAILKAQLELTKAEKIAVAEVWERVTEASRARKELSEALSPYIPAAERVMIAVGEQSGNWTMGFREARFVAEVVSKIQGALVGALFYPVVLLLFGAAISAGIAIEVAPQLVVMLDRPLEQWPQPSRWLYLLGEWMLNWGPWAGAALVALLVVAMLSLPRWTYGQTALGRWWGVVRYRFLDRYVPPYNIYREYQASSVLIALGALLRAGRPIEAALLDIGKISSPWMRHHIKQMTDSILGTRPVGEAMDTGLLSKPVVRYIKMFDKFGTFQDALDAVGRRGVDRTIKRVTAQANWLRNVALILVMGMIILIYAGVIAPARMIYSEAQSGTTAAQ